MTKHTVQKLSSTCVFRSRKIPKNFSKRSVEENHRQESRVPRHVGKSPGSDKEPKQNNLTAENESILCSRVEGKHGLTTQRRCRFLRQQRVLGSSHSRVPITDGRRSTANQS